MMTKTKTIAVTACKRPQYFERLILSLIKNDLQDWEIYIQLEPSHKEKYYFEIAERLLKPYEYFIGVNSSVLGVRDNPYHMLDKVFISGSLCCIYLEEDFIVSPDITKIANWYLKQDLQDTIALNFMMGGCNSAGFVSHTHENSSFIKMHLINSLGLVFTNEQWEQHIKPNWYRNVDYAMGHNGALFNGWDLALYDYVLSHAELFVLQPVCARATHIGEEGSTHTTKHFQKLAFTDLEIYEGAPGPDYKIVNDLYSFPYSLRSHLNLWQEFTEALVTLKRVKRSEAQSERQVDKVNEIIEKIYQSKSWRFTFPLRWFNGKRRWARDKLLGNS